MGPVEVLAAGWERLHPASGALPDLDAFDRVAQIVQATSPEEASSHRARIVDALCATGEPVGIDVSDPRWLRHADGTLEETLHLGTPPAHTSPWWLSYLLQVPLPSTVAVHIRVGDRSRTRSAQRRRWARLRAAVDYKDRRGRLVGHDETDALQEASQLDSELAASVAATVYDVSVYASYRHPGGDEDELDELLRDVAKTFGSFTDARVQRGRFLGAAGFASTLPLGVDRLRATRRYAHRNIGHCVPLATGSCGCPNGLAGTRPPPTSISSICVVTAVCTGCGPDGCARYSSGSETRSSFTESTVAAMRTKTTTSMPSGWSAPATGCASSNTDVRRSRRLSDPRPRRSGSRPARDLRPWSTLCRSSVTRSCVKPV